MLADAAVIFPIGGVARQVQFVFDAPVSPVESEQAMFVRFLCAEAGNPANGFDGGDAFLGAGTVYFEDLRGERKVDACCMHGCGDDPPGRDPSVGFFMRAVG